MVNVLGALNDFDKYMLEITDMSASRLEKGRNKYGENAFMERDSFTDLYEEIIDGINYLKLYYVKMRRLEERVNPH